MDQVQVRQDRPLHGQLAGQPQDAFEVPDVAGVGQRLGHVPVGDDAAGLVGEEQDHDQADLAKARRAAVGWTLGCTVAAGSATGVDTSSTAVTLGPRPTAPRPEERPSARTPKIRKNFPFVQLFPMRSTSRTTAYGMLRR
ncbi:hypothetical protein ACFQX7_26215 [Luedemannella flava]